MHAYISGVRSREGRDHKDRFAEFAAYWGQRYPVIVQLWESSWASARALRRSTTWRSASAICTTNAIESINARYRRVVRT